MLRSLTPGLLILFTGYCSSVNPFRSRTFSPVVDTERLHARGGTARVAWSDSDLYSPAMDSSGRYMVYASNPDGHYDLFLRPMDGAEAIRLTYSVTTQRDPAISPDGKRIAYVDDEFDPDGDILVYSFNPSDFVNSARKPENTRKLAIRRTKTAKNLTNDKNRSLRGRDDHPAWSPDGKRIAFSSDRTTAESPGNPGSMKQDIWIMNADDGGSAVRITNDGGVMPSFSPDGNQLVYISYEKSGGSGDVCVIDLVGSSRACLPSSPFTEVFPSFTHNGARIVFTRISQDGNNDGITDRRDPGQIISAPNPLSQTDSIVSVAPETSVYTRGNDGFQARTAAGNNLLLVRKSAAGSEIEMIPDYGDAIRHTGNPEDSSPISALAVVRGASEYDRIAALPVRSGTSKSPGVQSIGSIPERFSGTIIRMREMESLGRPLPLGDISVSALFWDWRQKVRNNDLIAASQLAGRLLEANPDAGKTKSLLMWLAVNDPVDGHCYAGYVLENKRKPSCGRIPAVVPAPLNLKEEIQLYRKMTPRLIPSGTGSQITAGSRLSGLAILSRLEAGTEPPETGYLLIDKIDTWNSYWESRRIYALAQLQEASGSRTQAIRNFRKSLSLAYKSLTTETSDPDISIPDLRLREDFRTGLDLLQYDFQERLSAAHSREEKSSAEWKILTEWLNTAIEAEKLGNSKEYIRSVLESIEGFLTDLPEEDAASFTVKLLEEIANARGNIYRSGSGNLIRETADLAIRHSIRLHQVYEKDGILSPGRKTKIVEAIFRADQDLRRAILIEPDRAEPFLSIAGAYQYLDVKRASRPDGSDETDAEIYRDIYDRFYPAFLFEENSALYRQAAARSGNDSAADSSRLRFIYNLNAANNYFLLGNYGKSHELYQSVLSLDPDRFFLNPAGKRAFYYHSGRAAFLSGENEPAIRSLEVARKLYREAGMKSQVLRISRYLGKIYLESGNNEAAIRELQELLAELKKEKNRADMSWVHMHLASAFFASGDLKQADASLDTMSVAMSAEPEVKIPRRYIKLGIFGYSFPVFPLPVAAGFAGENQILFPIPTIHRKQFIHSMKGQIHESTGNLNKVISAYRQLVHLADQDPSGHGQLMKSRARLRLGAAYSGAGRFKDALRLFGETRELAMESAQTPLEIQSMQNESFVRMQMIESTQGSQRMKLARESASRLSDYTRDFVRRAEDEAIEKQEQQNKDIPLSAAERYQVREVALQSLTRLFPYRGLYNYRSGRSQSTALPDDVAGMLNGESFRDLRGILMDLSDNIREPVSGRITSIASGQTNSMKASLRFNRAIILAENGVTDMAVTELEKLSEAAFEFRSDRLSMHIRDLQYFLNPTDPAPLRQNLSLALSEPDIALTETALLMKNKEILVDDAVRSRNLKSAIRSVSQGNLIVGRSELMSAGTSREDLRDYRLMTTRLADLKTERTRALSGRNSTIEIQQSIDSIQKSLKSLSSGILAPDFHDRSWNKVEKSIVNFSAWDRYKDGWILISDNLAEGFEYVKDSGTLNKRLAEIKSAIWIGPGSPITMAIPETVTNWVPDALLLANWRAGNPDFQIWEQSGFLEAYLDGQIVLPEVQVTRHTRKIVSESEGLRFPDPARIGAITAHVEELSDSLEVSYSLYYQHTGAQFIWINRKGRKPGYIREVLSGKKSALSTVAPGLQGIFYTSQRQNWERQSRELIVKSPELYPVSVFFRNRSPVEDQALYLAIAQTPVSSEKLTGTILKTEWKKYSSDSAYDAYLISLLSAQIQSNPEGARAYEREWLQTRDPEWLRRSVVPRTDQAWYLHRVQSGQTATPIRNLPFAQFSRVDKVSGVPQGSLPVKLLDTAACSGLEFQLLSTNAECPAATDTDRETLADLQEIATSEAEFGQPDLSLNLPEAVRYLRAVTRIHSRFTEDTAGLRHLRATVRTVFGNLKGRLSPGIQRQLGEFAGDIDKIAKDPARSAIYVQSAGLLRELAANMTLFASAESPDRLDDNLTFPGTSAHKALKERMEVLNRLARDKDFAAFVPNDHKQLAFLYLIRTGRKTEAVRVFGVFPGQQRIAGAITFSGKLFQWRSEPGGVQIKESDTSGKDLKEIEPGNSDIPWLQSAIPREWKESGKLRVRTQSNQYSDDAVRSLISGSGRLTLSAAVMEFWMKDGPQTRVYVNRDALGSETIRFERESGRGFQVRSSPDNYSLPLYLRLFTENLKKGATPLAADKAAISGIPEKQRAGIIMVMD